MKDEGQFLKYIKKEFRVNRSVYWACHWACHWTLHWLLWKKFETQKHKITLLGLLVLLASQAGKWQGRKSQVLTRIFFYHVMKDESMDRRSNQHDVT